MESISKNPTAPSGRSEAERMKNIDALDAEIREMKKQKTCSSSEIRKELGL